MNMNSVNFCLQVKINKYFLIILFLLSFLIRASVFYFYLGENKNYWQVDSNTYHKVAVDLSRGKGFSANGNPMFYRLPGYSLFLSIYYKIFGVDTKNVLWLQIFLASFIPILIFFLSLVLFPSFTLLAKVAALYSAVHLGLVLYSGFFMTESLFILFFLLFCILFFSSFHLFFCRRDIKIFYLNLICQPDICSGPGFQELTKRFELENERSYKIFTLKKLFFAGLFLGLASLVRPVGHYFIVFSLILLLFSRCFFKEKIIRGSSLFIGWIIPTSVWLIRNYLLLGQIFFHTLPGGHFLCFSATRVVMRPFNCSYKKARQILTKEVLSIVKKQEKKLGQKVNEIEYCDIRMKVALKYFLKYPFLSLKHWINDVLRTSLSLYSSELIYLESGRVMPDYFNKKHTLRVMFKRHLFPQTKSLFLKILVYFEIITFFLILLGFLLGFIFVFFNSMLCSWIKVIPFMLLFLVIGLAGGYSRMRLPIEPFLIIFSFSFWMSLISPSTGSGRSEFE